jgi:hypothetical protein
MSKTGERWTAGEERGKAAAAAALERGRAAAAAALDCWRGEGERALDCGAGEGEGSCSGGAGEGEGSCSGGAGLLERRGGEGAGLWRWRGGGQLQRRCLREGSWRRRCELLLRRWREGSWRRRRRCELLLRRWREEGRGFMVPIPNGPWAGWAAQGTKSTDLVSHVDDLSTGKLKSPASRLTCPESRVGLSSRNPRSAWTTSRRLENRDANAEILCHDWTRGRCPWGWQWRTQQRRRSIGSRAHWSEPKLLYTNCHEPWMNDLEPKRRSLADGVAAPQGQGYDTRLFSSCLP